MVKKKPKKSMPRKPSRKAPKKIRKPKKVFRKQKHSTFLLRQKPALKRQQQPKPSAPKKVFIGTVDHFFTDINVGVIKLARTLKAGDKISIQGATTNFKQKVESMQIDRNPVTEANKGDSIGLKVKGRVREKDKVFLVE